MGMAYLLGNSAADRQATGGDRQLISSIFDISPLTGCPETAVAWQPVGVGVNLQVGLGIYIIVSSEETVTDSRFRVRIRHI